MRDQSKNSSQLLRNLQLAGGVPYDKLVKVKENCSYHSENEEDAVKEIHCPFCGDKMSSPKYFDHYMNDHHGTVMQKIATEEEEEGVEKEFNKGQRVEYNGMQYSVEVPDAQADFVGIVPIGQEGDQKAVDLVRAHKLKPVSEEVSEPKSTSEDNTEFEKKKEALLKADDDRTKKRLNQQSKKRELRYDEAVETNTNSLLDRPTEWMEKKKDDDSVKVPGKVMSALKKLMKKTDAEIKKSDQGDDKVHQFYLNLKRHTQRMIDFMTNPTIEDCKRALIYLTALKSSMSREIPTEVWNWLQTGSKPSLKDYVNVVRAGDK